jgi:hypothetical protein
MFSLLLERNHRVLLTRFAGTFRRDVVEAQMVAARRIAAIEGPTRALYDFHDVEAVDIPYASLREMGRLPQTLPNQLRVYVMPKPELFGMGRTFATYQELTGNREPLIYRTMAEAYAALELKDPDFQPVEP